MRAAVLILLLCLAHIAWAQEKSVPTKEKFRLFKNRINKLSNLDTIKLPRATDSLRVAVDTIKRPTFFTGLKHKADSLKTPSFKSDTISIGFKKQNTALDSVNTITVPKLKSPSPSDSINRKVAGASDRITTRTASIQEKLKSKTDSVGVPDKINGLQEKLGNKINLNQPVKNENLAGSPTLPAVNSTPNAALPDFTLDAIRVPSANTSTQIPGLLDVKLPDQKADLPKVDVDNVNLPNADVPALDVVNKVQDKIPSELPTLTKPDSAQVNELKTKALEDERLEKYAEPVNEVSDRIDPYKKNLDSLTVKDAGTVAGKETEALLEKTEAMKTLNGYNNQGKETLNVPDAAALQRYQDKRILKEEMLRKSKSVMNDKISSLTPQVKDQQQKLGKAKKLNSSVPSVKNMKEKRSEPLKERPLYERIVPGISLQSHKSDVFAIDFAPQVSWRFTTYWSAGAGVFYRVGFDKRYDYFVAGQGIHGFRTFTDYRLVRGLFVHAEYEKTYASETFTFTDPSSPSVFNSMYIGLGKRYPLSRKIYGNLIALYKIELKDHLAGTSKFNLRVVFEYKTKKVRKPTDI